MQTLRFTLSLLFLALGPVSLLFGQSATVRGEVLDTNGKPVAFATIALMNAADSTLAKAGATTDAGHFELATTNAGLYQLSVSAVGMARRITPAFSVSAGQTVVIEPIILLTAATDLSAVTVIARKPLIEVLPDKLVFNVESSLNATGSNALELLQKSPGVVIDRDDNVLLQGSSGVRVYINGKPSPLAARELAAYLRSLQSADIEAIEIITQPSARYDAAGGAGIINIRLKKAHTADLGTSGSMSLGLAQGRFYPKFNGSLSVNHRTKRINTFASYSQRTARDWSFINLYREQSGQFFDQQSQIRANTGSHNVRAGADVFLDSRHTLGILLNANLNQYTSATQGRTPIGIIGQPATQLLIANNQGSSARQNGTANVNYRFADTTGHVFTADADYGQYTSDGSQYQPNQYTNSAQTVVLSERNYRMNTATTIRIATLKADYEQRLWRGTLSAGLKLSNVQTDNDFRFFDVLTDSRDLLNPDRSNRFVYTERINAGYLNHSRTIGKWNYQAGLRAEHTQSDGNLTGATNQPDAHVQRQYLNLFPSAGLTWQRNANNSFGLTYSKRIDRPTYTDLNPFESKLDELTYQKGNAFLRPQYTDNVQLSHTHKYTLNTSLGYGYTRDYFTSITDTIAASGNERPRNYISTRNLASRQTVTLSVSYPFQIAKWWSVYANLSAYRSTNRADLGAGRQISLTANVLSIYAQQTFTLPNGFSAEVSGFYTSPSVWGGTFLNRRFWGVDAGVQRKVLSGNGTLKLTVSDVFNVMQWRGISQFGGLYMDARGGWESRQVRLNFSYTLGNRQLKPARQRKTGSEDESGRVN